MRFVLKKPLVALLISLMVLPTWLGAEMIGATKAKAADPLRIVVNEIMPYPETGQKEWVELYNPNTFDVDLTGYILRDGDSNVFTVFGSSIAAKGYKVTEITPATLENAGDTVGLYENTAAIFPVDSFTYVTSTKGHSYGRSYDGGRDAVEFFSPTPDAKNMVATIVPAKAIGTVEKNQDVTISGTIDPSASYDDLDARITFYDPYAEHPDFKYEDIFQAFEMEIGTGSGYVNMLNGTRTSISPNNDLVAGVSKDVNIHFVVKDTTLAGPFRFVAVLIDKKGNKLSNIVYMKLTIKDTTAPVVTLTGDADMNIEVGSTFVDPGATVTDNLDTGLSADVAGVVDTNTLGDYTLTYSATDAAGNTSAPVVRTVHVVAKIVPAVKFTTTVDGKTVKIAWDKVAGATEYHVYIKNKASGAITASDSFVTVDQDTVLYQNNVAEYGQYYVLVIAKDAFGDLGTIPAAANQVVVDVTAPVVIIAPVVETPAPVVSVGPSKAQATAPAVTTPSADAAGKIKGDETATTDDEGNVNWTPWIVLFVLIILAGAATGGYFYWFGNEEETKEAPKTTKPAPKQEAKIVKEEVKTTVRNKNESAKKTKRW